MPKYKTGGFYTHKITSFSNATVQQEAKNHWSTWSFGHMYALFRKGKWRN